MAFVFAHPALLPNGDGFEDVHDIRVRGDQLPVCLSPERAQPTTRVTFIKVSFFK